MPIQIKFRYRCRIEPVRKYREATRAPRSRIDGYKTRLGPKRSTRRPATGMAKESDKAVRVIAREISPRSQPNSADRGFMNNPRDRMAMGAMLSAMPVTAADTTHQPKKILFTMGLSCRPG